MFKNNINIILFPFLVKVTKHKLLVFCPFLDSVQSQSSRQKPVNNNNNNCLKSNIQCIEIRVQWTVHLGSSHIQT